MVMVIIISLLVISNVFTLCFLAWRYKRNTHIAKITYTLWVGVEQLILCIEKNTDGQNKVNLQKIKNELITLKFYSKNVNKVLTKE